MHIIFQFPITDLRLIKDEGLRLGRPFWTSPDIDKSRPFIRQFGRLRDRKNGGVTGWPAEEHYCDARLSIKYKDIHKSGFVIDEEEKAIIYKAYRRLYSDGKFMNKIELGFFDDIEDRIKLRRPGTLIKLIDVLKHYSNLPIQIDGQNVELAASGPRLRDKFTRATTYKSKYTKTINKLVVDGQLNITVVLTSNDNIELPADARLINEYQVSQKKIRLYAWKMEVQQRSVKVWLIKVFKDTDLLPKENPVKTVVRNLRINLARIHAERETLRILLSNIMNGSVPLEAGICQRSCIYRYTHQKSMACILKDLITSPLHCRLRNSKMS